MKKRMVIDLLDAYADRVLRGGMKEREDWQLQADEQAAKSMFSDLFQLTEDLAILLKPVAPSPRFIQQLGTSLATAAVPPEIQIARPSSRRLWIGAILSGSLVSAAGVLLLFLRRRNRSRALAAG